MKPVHIAFGVVFFHNIFENNSDRLRLNEQAGVIKLFNSHPSKPNHISELLPKGKFIKGGHKRTAFGSSADPKEFFMNKGLSACSGNRIEQRSPEAWIAMM